MVVGGGRNNQNEQGQNLPLTDAERNEEMTPDFECILFHEQADNPEGVTKAIDDAVTIGENRGMEGIEIMRVYQQIKLQQREVVLAKALEFSAKREG